MNVGPGEAGSESCTGGPCPTCVHANVSPERPRLSPLSWQTSPASTSCFSPATTFHRVGLALTLTETRSDPLVTSPSERVSSNASSLSDGSSGATNEASCSSARSSSTSSPLTCVHRNFGSATARPSTCPKSFTKSPASHTGFDTRAPTRSGGSSGKSVRFSAVPLDGPLCGILCERRSSSESPRSEAAQAEGHTQNDHEHAADRDPA